MDRKQSYDIDTNVTFGPLELIDVRALHESCGKDWFNRTLCAVNDCVVRLGVVRGEFHWHSHEKEDEFFYVIEGLLLLDIEDRTVELGPRQGFMVPKGVTHRTRAPERTVMMMIEGAGVTPTGD